MDELRQLIEDHCPDVLIADPLAELHTALPAIIAEFRSIADDPGTARGASAIIGGARIILTLTTMTEEDAEALGIPTSRQSRSRYVRLDAKQNYAAIGDAQWYEKALYNLDNGEIVAAALPWTPPDIWRVINGAIANLILNDIDAAVGLKEG
ncbi:MAG: hypothetical protein JO007_03985 [Alphaproteobacteria bacterium]|nr:hypothetical protein [Alphaproteobacteria bacterium]